MKLVLLDWHGTICSTVLWERLRSDASQKALTDRLFAALWGEDHTLLQAWMRGQHTSETLVAQIAPLVEVSPEWLLMELEAGCREMRLSDAMRQSILALRKLARVELVTDNMDCFSRWTVPAQDLMGLFDRIWVSWEHGVFKNDDQGAWLGQICAAAGTPPEETILFEDRAKTCELFSQMGGKTVLVQSLEETEMGLRQLAHDLMAA